MKYEYKELMRKLKNISDDLVTYAQNEGSLSEKSKEELEKLDRQIVMTLNQIADREN